MLVILIKIAVPILTAIIGALGVYVAYGRTSKATIKSTSMTTRVNQKNMHVKQYNDLFERNDKLSNELYQVQRDSITKSQDSIVIFYELEDAISQLKSNGIKPHKQLLQVAHNYHRRLHDDSNNSL